MDSLRANKKGVFEMSAFTLNAKEILSNYINDDLKTQDIVFLCIGTERVMCDGLGARIGEKLLHNTNYIVYGTAGKNVDAKNYLKVINFINIMHPNAKIIAIDSAVGSSQQVGCIQVVNGGIVPGKATNKGFLKVGSLSIIGILAANGSDFFKTSPTIEYLLDVITDVIADAIISTASYN